MKNFKFEVYKLVKKIPEGRVSTYGEIALLTQKSNIKSQKYNSKVKISGRFLPRLVGFVLHQNKDPNVPCHRVVDRHGRLAPNFAGPSKPWRSGAFDGWEEQRRRLEVEGVNFRDSMHVDLEKCLWKFHLN